MAPSQLDTAAMMKEGNRPATVSSIYALDTDRLNELYGEDTDYAVIMFETFLETVLPEFDAFDKLIEEERWGDVGLLAHKLRPPLGMVGLSNLEVLLAQFEELVTTTNDLEQINHSWYQFHSSLLSCTPLVQTEWQRLLTITTP